MVKPQEQKLRVWRPGKSSAAFFLGGLDRGHVWQEKGRRPGWKSWAQRFRLRIGSAALKTKEMVA